MDLRHGTNLKVTSIIDAIRCFSIEFLGIQKTKLTLLDIQAHWDVQKHRQLYKHLLDMLRNNILEIQDKFLTVFFQ